MDRVTVVVGDETVDVIVVDAADRCGFIFSGMEFARTPAGLANPTRHGGIACGTCEPVGDARVWKYQPAFWRAVPK